MKKYIVDMTCEELREVWENNSKLRAEVWEDAISDVDFWISEYLHGIGRAADYEIGTYGHNYMTVKNIPDFLEWVKSCNRSFGIFYDLERDKPGNVVALCENADELHERLDYGVYSKRDGCYYDLSDDDAERVENRLDEILELFTDAFLDLCRREYDFFDDDENLFQFWEDESELCNYFDCFIDDEMDGGKALRRVVTHTYYFN